MKEQTTLTINGEKYELLYTLGIMRQIERTLGCSLISILTRFDGNAQERVGIDFIMANLQYAVVGGLSEDKAYDLIDKYCEGEGTLDTLAGFLMMALYNTGFFIPKLPEEVEAQVYEKLRNDNFSIVSWKTINQNLLKAVQFEKFVLIAILSLLLVIASFAVSVILNMIVREKIKDIGILKSIGYTNKNIRRIFTIEGLIIGVFGMIMASGLSPLVLIGLKILFKEYMKGGTYYLEELPLYISQKELLIIYGVTFVVVFLSTIFPAARAARLKPVEALKYE